MNFKNTDPRKALKAILSMADRNRRSTLQRVLHGGVTLSELKEAIEASDNPEARQLQARNADIFCKRQRNDQTTKDRFDEIFKSLLRGGTA